MPSPELLQNSDATQSEHTQAAVHAELIGPGIVDAEPATISDEVAGVVRAQFLDVSVEDASRAANVDPRHVYEESKQRFDMGVLTKIQKSEPGNAVNLLRPENGGLPEGVKEVAAVQARQVAAKSAAQILGVSDRDFPSYAADAKVEIFAAKEGGAARIAVRTTELPGGTIIETNAYGAGSDIIEDTQVTAIRKAS